MGLCDMFDGMWMIILFYHFLNWRRYLFRPIWSGLYPTWSLVKLYMISYQISQLFSLREDFFSINNGHITITGITQYAYIKSDALSPGIVWLAVVYRGLLTTSQNTTNVCLSYWVTEHWLIVSIPLWIIVRNTAYQFIYLHH